MNHDEMLSRLKLTEAEFRELLSKFSEFVESLNERQGDLVTASMPTLVQAAASFGPDVDPEDLARLLREFADDGVVIVMNMRAIYDEDLDRR
jgi:hypothetical protein